MRLRPFCILVCAFIVLLTACGGSETPPTAIAVQSNTTTSDSAENSAAVESNSNVASEAAAVPTLEPTEQIVPTATPRPLAAQVNGEPIFVDHYQGVFVRYQQWYPNGVPNGQPLRKWVLDVLIDEVLLLQVARENGLEVSAENIQTEIDKAKAESGGEEAYRVWLDNSGFTEEAFRSQVSADLTANNVIEFVTKDVPFSAEAVRASYIQTDDFAIAQTVLSELEAGAEFTTLVELYSIEQTKNLTKGDLGSFQRGFLLVKEVEDAAFALQPDEISPIVTMTRSDGSESYFVVKTTERNPSQELTAEERANLAQETFEAWLADRRAAAQLDVLIPLD